MRTTVENPAGAPGPVGPYSQVARLDFGSGGLLVLAGQIAVDGDGNLVGEGDMTVQAERIFEIIAALLKPYGASLDDVINIRTYLVDLSQLREYGAVRGRLFPGQPPTSTTVEVSALFRPGALLEVEVMATTG